MLKQEKKPAIAEEFVPALDADPVFERPETGRWDRAPKNEFRPSSHNPTGAWIDGRSSFGLDSAGGPGFIDPGSFALASQTAPLLMADSVPTAALDSASLDLGGPTASDGAASASGDAGASFAE